MYINDPRGTGECLSQMAYQVFARCISHANMAMGTIVGSAMLLAM